MFIGLAVAVAFVLIGRFFKLTWAVLDLPSVGWGNHISIADLGRIWQTAAEKEVEVIVGGGRWRVEVAADNWSRAQGLSGRKSLPAGGGMLFVFNKAGRHSFWMKGMNFPLDFIWINDGRVVDITANVPPFSLRSSASEIFYKPKQPANMVLEINAGEAARYGVKIGDLVKLNQ